MKTCFIPYSLTIKYASNYWKMEQFYLNPFMISENDKIQTIGFLNVLI